jgi:hypothetical protein
MVAGSSLNVEALVIVLESDRVVTLGDLQKELNITFDSDTYKCGLVF